MQFGRTLLHYAADRGRVADADLLLENKADANSLDEVTNPYGDCAYGFEIQQ